VGPAPRFSHLTCRPLQDPIQIGDRLLVVFDGHCGLCNRSVRWLIQRDRRDRLRFTASDSAKVAGLLARQGFGAADTASQVPEKLFRNGKKHQGTTSVVPIKPTESAGLQPLRDAFLASSPFDRSFSAASGPGTILVVRDACGAAESVLVRSDAAVAVLGELPAPWPAIAKTLKWIPRSIRDLGYRLVARSRYQIWGRFEICPLPSAGDRQRFL